MDAPELPPTPPPPPPGLAASHPAGVPPFFAADPPHWVARGLAYLLIVLFATAVVGAIMVRLPEAVSCPFVLLPMHGTDPVRAPRSGIVGEIRVPEAASVRDGDPMFVIRSPDVGDRSAELHTLETALDGDQKHLGNAQHEHASQTLADDQEARKLEQQIAYLGRAVEQEKIQLAMTRDVLEHYDTAYRKGFASWVEYVNRRMEANRSAMDLAQLVTEEAETRAAQEKMRQEAAVREAQYAELGRGLAEDMEKTQIRIAARRQELTHSLSDELAVPAPCSGTVLHLAVKGVGAYVHEGDVLCELACSGERLEAELMLPESGVARIRSGQGVKLLYDAFPYERYGVKYGIVRWVSPSSMETQDGRRFRALADIGVEPVQVDGQPRPLVAGMGGTARVVVGRRSVISAAFAPLRELQEAFGDAPAKPLRADQEGISRAN